MFVFNLIFLYTGYSEISVLLIEVSFITMEVLYMEVSLARSHTNTSVYFLTSIIRKPP